MPLAQTHQKEKQEDSMIPFQLQNQCIKIKSSHADDQYAIRKYHKYIPLTMLMETSNDRNEGIVRNVQDLPLENQALALLKETNKKT